MVLKLTVEFIFNDVGATEADVLITCRQMGIEPSLISYVCWLVENEGLFGIVEDEYNIVKVEKE